MVGKILLATAALLAAAVSAGASVTPGLNGRVVFQSSRSGNSDIYAMNPDGSGLVRLTRSRAFDGLPGWSPTASKVLFESDRNAAGYEDSDVYVMNADGS